MQKYIEKQPKIVMRQLKNGKKKQLKLAEERERERGMSYKVDFK